MGGREITRAVSGGKFGRNLTCDTDSAAQSRRRTSDITGVTENPPDPVVQAPYKFTRPSSLRESKLVHHKVKSLSRVVRTRDDDLSQGDRRFKPDKPVLPSPSLLEQAAQLFNVQPLISRTGEEDLHFDLDPR